MGANANRVALFFLFLKIDCPHIWVKQFKQHMRVWNVWFFIVLPFLDERIRRKRDASDGRVKRYTHFRVRASVAASFIICYVTSWAAAKIAVYPETFSRNREIGTGENRLRVSVGEACARSGTRTKRVSEKEAGSQWVWVRYVPPIERRSIVFQSLETLML